jgi:hypothetical protein
LPILNIQNRILIQKKKKNRRAVYGYSKYSKAYKKLNHPWGSAPAYFPGVDE